MYTLDMRKVLGSDDIWLYDIKFSDGDVLMGFDRNICLIDEYSGEVKYTGDIPECYGMSFFTDSGVIYMALSGLSESDIDTLVYAIDSRTGRELWKQTVKDFAVDASGELVTDCFLMVCGTHDALILDRETGEFFKEHTFSDMIATCWVDDNWFYLMTDTGRVFYCDCDSVTEIKDFYNIAPSGDISDVIYKDGDIFCKYWISNYVIRYSENISPLAKQEDDFESDAEYSDMADTSIFEDEEYNVNAEMVSFAVYSVDKKYIMVQFIDSVTKIFDAETKECINSFMAPEEELYDFRYNDLTGCYIISGSRSYLLDDKFNIICETGVIVDRDGNELIMTDDEYVCYRIPWFSYEELIQKADEYLGGYVPSDEIKEKYGLQ
jgi:outer membrane protein assembly factor BamB